MSALPVTIVSGAEYPQPPAYSVWRVIREQARIVAELGYDVHVAAPAERELDEAWPDGARLRTVGGGLDALAERLAGELPDQVLILTHDLVTSSAGLDLVDRVAEGRPGGRWAHWLHGQPGTPGPEWTARYPLPQAWLVGQVDAQLEALQRVFKVSRRRVLTFPNHRSVPEYLGLGPIAASLVSECDWLECGIRAVFPARRTTNKDWPALFLLLTALAEAGEDVGLVALDLGAGASDEPDAFEDARARAERAGVRMAFSSDLGFNRGVPNQTVRELFSAGNLFVLPSVEETSSLVTAEALLCKNLVVLDERCSGAREVAGEAAVYLDFGRLPGDDAYRAEVAGVIRDAIHGNPVLAGQQRVVDQLGLAPGGERYAHLLEEMAEAPATGVDRVLCDTALARPFRALLHALLRDGHLGALADVDPSQDGVARALDATGRSRGVDGVADAFELLVRYERGFGPADRPASGSCAGKLAGGVTLLPYTPLMRRYEAAGRAADDPQELERLLAHDSGAPAFLLLRREESATTRALVDGEDALTLERWLAGEAAADRTIDDLRAAGFVA